MVPGLRITTLPNTFGRTERTEHRPRTIGAQNTTTMTTRTIGTNTYHLALNGEFDSDSD